MAQKNERKAALLPDVAQPLILAGPPRAVRGEFRVRNATDRKVVVRQPRVTAATATGRPKGDASMTAISGDALALRRIVVRAGQSRPVAVDLALDPRTPPGTYHAALDVDGEQRPVVMHVTEDVALTMAPSEIVLDGRPGEKVQRRVVITNDGNVPLAVNTIGAVVLDEDLVHCRALRGALADVGDTMKSLDEFAVALGRRYHDLYDTRVLRVQNDAVTIAPGETLALALTITLPEKLEPRSRYTGFAAISTDSLAFTIVPA